MEQQHLEEYFDRNVGQALERLSQLQPGQSISFVGLRDLAEVLVENAFAQGMKVQAKLQDGFNAHILTLLEKAEPVPEDFPAKQVARWRLWVRYGILSVFYGVWDVRR